MQIELSSVSQAKLENVLEHLHTRYDLEALTPNGLVEALLGLGVDLVVAEEPSVSLGRDRLIEYCGRSVEMMV